MLKNYLKFWNRNLTPKIIAFLLAIVAWFVVMENINETTTGVFSDIPVQLEGIEELSNNDLIIGDIDNPNLENPTVDVRVQGQWRDVRNMKRDDITLRARIPSTRTGTVTVPIETTLKNNAIIVDSLSQRNLQIVLDRVEIQDKNFRLITQGNVPDGVTLGDVDVPDTVKVQGPSKTLESIAYVTGAIDYSEHDRSFSVYVDREDLSPMDANDQVVQGVTIEDPYVEVVATYIREKEVPVKIVHDSFNNDRFALTDIIAEPATVTIRGKDDILDEIQEISTIQLNIGSYENDVEVPVTLSIPSGISRVDDEEIKALLSISPYETKTFQFRRQDIVYEGTNNDLNYEISNPLSSITVNIMDTREVLSSIKQEDLSLTINVQGMDEATWTPSVNVEGAPKSSVITISPETIQVIISAVEEDDEE